MFGIRLSAAEMVTRLVMGCLLYSTVVILYSHIVGRRFLL
jgi:hypothetical protein